MTCKRTEELLTRYALGDLEAAARARVDAHLAACPACRAALADVQPTVDLLRQTLSPAAGAAPRLDPARRAWILASYRAESTSGFPRRLVKAAGSRFVRERSATRDALLALAAVLVICVLGGMMLPALSVSRHRACMVTASRSQEQALEMGEALDQIEAEGAPQPAEADTRSELSARDAAADLHEGNYGQKPQTLTGEFRVRALTRKVTGSGDETGRADAPADLVAFSAPLLDAEAPARKTRLKGLLPSAGEKRAAGVEVQMAETEPSALAAAPATPKPAPVMVAGKAKDRSYDDPNGPQGAAAEPAPPLITFKGPYDGQTSAGRPSGPGASQLNRAEARERGSVTAEYAMQVPAKPAADEAAKSVVRDAETRRAVEQQVVLAERKAEASAREDSKPQPVDKQRELADEEGDRTVDLAYPAQVFNPIVESRQQPFSTFAIDVDTASFALARRALLEGRRPAEGAIRVEEFVNAFEYDYRPPERDTFAVYTDRARSPFRPSLDLLRIGVRGKVVGRDRMRPSVLTVVIDTSGSMNTPDRLDLIRSSLALLVDRLGPRDRVAIVTFGSEARLVLDGTPASKKNEIRAVLEGLQTAGSTHLEAGLRLGYAVAARNFASGALNRVLLLSDGVANMGAASAREILAQVERDRQQGIYCSVFGFGQGTYNDRMLEALADKGDGVYRFVDSPAEARRVFVDDLAATLCVIARDVKIQVEFNPERVARYRQLGYENRQLTKEQFRDDAVDAGEVGAGQSATALYELETTGHAAEPLGCVRLRWKDTETGAVQERAVPIGAGERAAAFEQAPVRFRLAAGAAEFADVLRRNPFTAGTTMKDVAAVVRPIGLELHLDQQVRDLVRMVTAVRD